MMTRSPARAGAVDLVGDRLQPRPAVIVGERVARAHLLDIGLGMEAVAVLEAPAEARRRALRRSCSCPSPRRPSPPARKACIATPSEILRQRVAIDQPDRLALRCARAAGRFVACEARASRSRACLRRDQEQHLAAGGQCGQRQTSRAARTARHCACGTPTTQRSVSSIAG